jgi:amino acid adenylation domain-containing protein
VEYPEGETVLDLFAHQVGERPDAIAVVYEGEEMTYQELDEWSNQLAHCLQANGVKEESLVPLCIERSLAMIVGVLGILKSGGAYVPIDPSYPIKRKEFILEDTQGMVVVGGRNSYEEELLAERSVIDLTSEDADYKKYSTEPLMTSPDPSSLIYVIYTSGTTGQPKGVMIEHRGVYNLVRSQKDLYKINCKDHILQFSPLIFDASVEQIWISLLSGASLYIPNKESLSNSKSFYSYIQQNEITHLHCTPTFLKGLDFEENKSLKRIVSAGEECPYNLASKYYKQVNFYNKYGPSEATISVVIHLVESLNKSESVIPIGKPIKNSQIFILSKWGELLPKGATGEIYIGGSGLSRGYLNEKELTARVFIENPVSSGKLFRTGDFGKINNNNEIVFQGRLDSQIKFRGVRIETSEIESELSKKSEINKVYVTLINKKNNQFLIAYYTSKVSINKEVLREYLSEKLPSSFMPTHFIEVDDFPILPSGKIDDKSLPVPEILNRKRAEKPKGNTAEILFEIWKDTLGLNARDFGVHHNFFELGGHSLILIRMVSEIKVRLKVKITIKELFQNPTISEQEKLIERVDSSQKLFSIEKVDVKEEIPLSYSQERIWLADQIHGSTNYHIPFVLKIEGKISRKILEYCFSSIVERHTVLKTIFYEENGRAYQKQKLTKEIKIQVKDIANFSKEEWLKLIREEISTPFDLSKDFMLRCKLYQIMPDEAYLVVTVHHIAADAWSIPILMSEFTELYNSELENRKPDLPQLKVQYKDYAHWQTKLNDETNLKSGIQYWERKLKNLAPFDLTTNRLVVENSSASESVDFEISEDVSKRMTELTSSLNTTDFTGYLALFYLLLYKYSGKNDICIGTPVANRSYPEIENLIGFFLNTIPIRSIIDEETSFKKYLELLRDGIIEDLSHSEVPLEKIIQTLYGKEEINSTSLFQVFFNMQTQNSGSKSNLNISNLKFEKVDLYNEVSKFDLSLYMTKVDHSIYANFTFRKGKYSKNYIKKMTKHFNELLITILKSPNDPIKSFDYRTKEEIEEKDRTLNEFFN